MRHIISADVEGSGILFLEIDWTPLREGEADGVEEVDKLLAEAVLIAPAPLLDFFFLVMVTIKGKYLVKISAGRA